MLNVQNSFNEVSYTSNIIINQANTEKLSDVNLKYSFINIPDALPSEKKGGINGTSALRYRL